jgi:uncharacterized protein (TIGR02284 family)
VDRLSLHGKAIKACLINHLRVAADFESRHHSDLPARNKQGASIMANTLDGSTKNKETEKVLLDVIKSLQDGQKGFAEIGEHLKDEKLKLYFLAESQKRAAFRAELENELHRAGMADVTESGSTAGTFHRAWGELKAKLGGSDHTLLETAEQGEDEAKKAYKDAFEHELPLPIHQLLSTQQAHVINVHNYVRDHRDATANK